MENALDLIENQFTGTKKINAMQMGHNKDLELFLFNQIPSSRKSYNKILDKNTQSFESSLTQDGKKEFY